MQLENSRAFDARPDDETFWQEFPQQPAVFALSLSRETGARTPPYLSRTTDLRRRLMRLLARPRPPVEFAERSEKILSISQPSRSSRPKPLNLRDLVSSIAFRCVGSSFEARWLLYELNKHYYPDSYRQRLRLRPPTLLKVNLKNRFPRCYPTRKLSGDGSLYYGPFASRTDAERFAAEFLDFFFIRRCVEDLNPDPSHPGCIYSQMHMCLAPCFQGCTNDEYQQELGRVIAFLDSEGKSLIRSLEGERAQASEKLAFEEAAKLHRKLEKEQEVLRLKPNLARNLRDLHAVILQRGSEAKTIAFFRVAAGELCGPATLSLDERVASPESLDEQIRRLFDSLDPQEVGGTGSLSPAFGKPIGTDETGREQIGAKKSGFLSSNLKLPPWEHLSILARWYYSSFREGEIIMLPSRCEVPHARLIRLCRKLIAV